MSNLVKFLKSLVPIIIRGDKGILKRGGGALPENNGAEMQVIFFRKNPKYPSQNIKQGNLL